MRKRTIICMLFLMVSSLFVVSQVFANGQGEKSSTKSGVRVVRVGLSWDTQTHDLVQAWQGEMESYGKVWGKQHNIQFNWVVDVADGNPSTQASQITDLINQHVNVIVARAADAAAIGSSILAAKRAGIPFITFDRQSSTAKPVAHVGGDSYQQGIQAATAFAALLKKHNITGRCIDLEGALTDINAVNRQKAWVKIQNQDNQWTTVATVPTNWEPSKFYTGTVNALAAHPNANCMFVASDFAFNSVEKALKEAGRLAPTGQPGHIWIATCDLEPEGLNAMEKGYIDVSSTYAAYAQADELVKVMGQIVDGNKVAFMHLVPGALATPANVSTIRIWSKAFKN